MNDKLEINKAIVSDFYNLAFNLKNPQEFADKHIGSYYRQYNPGAPDGKEPFIAFVNWVSEDPSNSKVRDQEDNCRR